MATKQIQKLLGQLVEHQEVFESMSPEDRQWVIQNSKTAIGLFAACVRQYAHGSPSNPKSLEDVVRSEFITVLAEYNASAVSVFDLSRHFKDGRDRGSSSPQFPAYEHDVPARTLKLLRLKDRGDLPLEMVYSLGYDPVVHLSHVHEFARAWDQNEVQWFSDEPKYKSFGFVLGIKDDLSVNCHINRFDANADTSKDWFLGCEYQPFNPDKFKQAKRCSESLILVNGDR